MMLILSLGFLACLILKEILCILCFTLFFLVYLYYRFKNKRILILFFLFSLLSCILVYPKEVQQQDTYKITEIKKGYYIGKNRGSKILIQTDLDLSFQDEVKVKHIEPIHTNPFIQMIILRYLVLLDTMKIRISGLRRTL